MVNISEVVEQLKIFGFGKYEASAYVSLIKNGVLTAPAISQAAGVPKGKVYDVVQRLVDKQLVEYCPGSPKRFKAASPSFVFDRILAERKRKTDEMEQNVSAMKKVLEGLTLSEKKCLNTENVLWTVNGRQAFHEKYAEMGWRAQKEVLVISPYFSRHPLIDRCETELKKRGVERKGITSLNPENASRVRYYIKIFDEIRNFSGEIPLTVIIVDRKECMYRMQYETDGQTNYVGVHSMNKGLVEHFLQYWNGLWKGSKPLASRDVSAAVRKG